MKITTLRSDSSCPNTRTCPSIHRLDTDPEGLYVITKKVTDLAVLAAFAPLIAGDEQLGRAPESLLPELRV